MPLLKWYFARVIWFWLFSPLWLIPGLFPLLRGPRLLGLILLLGFLAVATYAPAEVLWITWGTLALFNGLCAWVIRSQSTDSDKRSAH